jgi:hypothetical protein
MPSWFTCASLAFNAETGEEFIVIGTSSGIIFKVNVAAGH